MFKWMQKFHQIKDLMIFKTKITIKNIQLFKSDYRN